MTRPPRELLLGDLRARWLEYLLVGCVIGAIAGIVVVQRVVAGTAESEVHDLAHRIGKNMLVVPREADLVDFHGLQYGDAGMPEDYPDEIRKSELGQHVRVVNSRLLGNVEVNNVELILLGEAGPPGPPGGAMSQAPEVALGAEAAQRLGLEAGDSVTIRGTSVVIGAVVPYPPDGLGMGAFTDLKTAQLLLQRPGEINALRLGGCWCRLDVPQLAGQIENLLPGSRAVTVAGVLKAQKGTVATMKRYGWVLYLVSLILVGGAVMALMSSQVRRSLREIGLLISLGTSPALVWLLLVGRAAAIGLLGGGIGYLLGTPLTRLLGSTWLQLNAAPSPDLLLPLLALCAGVSALAALPAARWAAQVDPCRVLRED